MTEPRPYIITTTLNGQTATHHMQSTKPAPAISAAIELHGPGATLVSCLREGEWK